MADKATRRFEQSDSRGTVRVEVDYMHGEPPGAAEVLSQLTADRAYSDGAMQRRIEAVQAIPDGPSEVSIRISIQGSSEKQPRTIELSAGEFGMLVKSVRRNLPAMGTDRILGAVPRSLPYGH